MTTIYIKKPDTNPLSIRERRTPALPLFKISQTVGLIALIALLFLIHGTTLSGLRSVIAQTVLLAFPVYWLFDTTNGSVRIERMLTIAFFFSRLLLRMPKKHTVIEPDEATSTGETVERIEWYEDGQTVRI